MASPYKTTFINQQYQGEIKCQGRKEQEEKVGQGVSTYDWNNSIKTLSRNHSISTNTSSLNDTITSFNQENIAKFINSIIDFKIGKAQQIEQSQIINKTIINTTSVIIEEGRSYQQNQHFSTQRYSQTTYINQNTNVPSKYSITNPENRVIHPGIQCDQCHQLPIIGTRFKCKQCQDFDFCEKCHNQSYHKHSNFQQIKFPKRYLQKQRLKCLYKIENKTHANQKSLAHIINKVNNFLL